MTAPQPSAERIQYLVELTRRDPGSPAFVELGEAYIAFGRPNEAIDVGLHGLQTNQNSVEGRMMISRAYAALHQWKEAQGELLKIVKLDRNYAPAFVLLGEVLLRRDDYERAYPVLQHAQNLDAQNPWVAEMLRRAYARQPLDPPAPVPSAAPTGGYGAPPAYAPPPAYTAPPAAPTAAYTAPPAAYEPPPAAYGPPPASYGPPPAAPPLAAPPMAPAAPSLPQATAQPAQGKDDGGEKKKKRKLPTQIHDATTARPRVLPAQKPKGEALQSLRKSAALGENFLNDLLTAGILNVPQINAPVADFERVRGKRWGRSAKRMFLFLFVLLFSTIGGGGAWIYWAGQQRKADVAKHIAEAERLLALSRYEDLKGGKTLDTTGNVIPKFGAVGEAQGALKRDPANAKAAALYARATAMQALLYGDEPQAVSTAIAAASKELTEGEDGYRDIALAKAALGLATLKEQDNPTESLKETRRQIDEWIGKHSDDADMLFLQGVAMEAAGERKAALEAYQKAGQDGKGSIPAAIYAADMLLDSGDRDGATKLYDAVLARAEEHTLAWIGKILARIETSSNEPDKGKEENAADAVFGEFNIHFDQPEADFGPRVTAYRSILRAQLMYVLGDYAKFSESLNEAAGTGWNEPRFLGLLGLGRVAEGKITDAVDIRAKIAWYGDKPEPHPLVTLLEAELVFARGLPQKALEVLGDIATIGASRLRGRALYELGKPQDALAEFKKILEVVSHDIEADVWVQAIKVVTDRGKERRDADAELDRLARASKNKGIRYIHGHALVRNGDDETDARNELKTSIEELTAEEPNPLAYRAHTELAELDIAKGKVEDAQGHLEEALKQVPGYLPALGLKGAILVSQNKHAEAMDLLKQVMDEGDAVTSAMIDLAYAEALVAGGKASDQDRKTAQASLERAKAKGADKDNMARVAEMIDPALVKKLDLD